MAVTIRAAAVRDPAAVAECREIARIASRPAASSFRQVDNGQLPVDGLLVGKIYGVRNPALGEGDVHYISISIVHLYALRKSRKGLALQGASHTNPQGNHEKTNFQHVGARFCVREPVFLLF
jgi:hypothetical protein